MGAKFDRCVRKIGASLRRTGKRGNAFAICTAALKPLMVTSKDAGHRHTWRKGNKFTSSNNITGKHRHKIRGKTALKSRPNGHTHRLLMRRRRRK